MRRAGRLKVCQDVGCELVEQPVQARYLDAMAELTHAAMK